MTDEQIAERLAREMIRRQLGRDPTQGELETALRLARETAAGGPIGAAQ